MFGHSAPVTAAALSLDSDVGLDALDNSHVKMAEVLHLLHLTADVAFGSTLLLAEAALLALLAHLLLAVQLRERRSLLASQG